MRKRLLLSWVLVFLFFFTVPVSADMAVMTLSLQDLAIEGESGILFEPATQTVLWEKNADERMAPASVTKIMTMLLVLEAMEEGTLTADTVVTASINAKEMGGSQINLDIGEEMTVHDLMMAVAVASANDAALALAETIGGSEAGFVTMMNRRAAELGMENTLFQNPHGLPAEGHYTSAADIAKMTGALVSHPLAETYLSCETYTVRPDTDPYQMRTTNKMLSSYDGCIGGKTGYTEEAGYCMSVAAKREEMTLIAVAMKEETSERRQADLKRLLDFGFGHYALKTIPAKPINAKPIPVKNGMENEVSLLEPEITSPVYLTEKGVETEAVQQTSLPEFAEAPIKEGESAGKVTFTVDGKEIACYHISYAETVEKRTVFLVFKRLFSNFIKL